MIASSIIHAEQLLDLWLHDNRKNLRVGDFLHRDWVDVDGEYLVFRNPKGDKVSFSMKNSVDVRVYIKYSSRNYLESILCRCLQELVGRHGQQLHTAGSRQFRHCTIILPSVHDPLAGLEVKIIPGSSGFYDQGYIAYELMAALSGVPAYKVIAPMYYCGKFLRTDSASDTAWIGYYYKSLDVTVSFSHTKEPSHLTVNKKSFSSKKERETFKHLMAACFSEYVAKKTGKKFQPTQGVVTYIGSTPDNFLQVLIEETSLSYSISVSIPYHDDSSWPRVTFARSLMERISEAFR